VLVLLPCRSRDRARRRSARAHKHHELNDLPSYLLGGVVETTPQLQDWFLTAMSWPG
jgi:hypothetical protein